MTSGRWRQIVALFEAALRIEPAQRVEWLRLACGADDDLRAEVGRLLARNDRVGQSDLRRPAPSAEVAEAGTIAGTDPPAPPRRATPLTHVASVIPSAPDGWSQAAGGFTPRTALVSRAGRQAAPDAPAGESPRLRNLASAFLALTALGLVWRNFVLGNYDPVLSVLNVAVIAGLGWLILRLSNARTFAPARLRSLEVGMVAIVAGMFSVGLYRNLLVYSMAGNLVSAHVVLRNAILMTSIIILVYGIHAPKNWRQTGVVAGPLALVPFVTMLVLYLRYPQAMAWLREHPAGRWTTPLVMISFDAMFLLLLAAGSSYGTYKIARLRRQVAEARELGQYTLGPRIGRGGMGEVYLAEHQLLKRPCAIKLVRPGHEADPRILERFEREVRLTATLSHWNTVEIYDYGRAEDGTYYYVMEYLPGLSLEAIVERHGPMPAERVVYLIRQVCQALREAHAAGLIHRDIKPSNIFAARRGGVDDVAKLLDFGLVLSRMPDSGPHLTAIGKVVGTPLFMAPEQAESGGRNVDARSDIYSVGAVAYYLLTGRPPFDHDDPMEVMMAHARDSVVAPSQLQPDLPADLERVVLRCLAKNPADRFPDAESLEHALAGCASADGWDTKRAADWWLRLGAPAEPATTPNEKT